MIDGSMQDFPLTLDKFLLHAAKWHPRAEVVTAGEGGVARIGYAELHDRALGVSGVLAGFGVQPGDRVATLAWNSQAHVEAWYAIMGMGAVCHTLNPRLTGAQLASMATQSEARLLVASADLLGLALQIADRAPGIRRILVIDREGDLELRGGGAAGGPPPAGGAPAPPARRPRARRCAPRRRATWSGACSPRPRLRGCASPRGPPVRPRA